MNKKNMDNGKTDPGISYAYLETTNYCNLDCKFCNRRNVVKRPQHMSLENWERVLSILSDQPIQDAKLMGLGEPFFHPQFHVICQRFKDVFPRAFTISATNCQFTINDNFIKTLPFISLLYLSIDGYEESYEKHRPGASWSRALKFLDDLAVVCKTQKPATRIAINYVATDQNYLDIPKLNKLVSSKYSFIEEVRLNVAQWWGEGEEVGIEMSEPFLEMLMRFRQHVKGKAPWTYSQCFWPRKGFYMNVKGDVNICCMNTSTDPIGNIFQDSLFDLLNSTKRMAIRRECELDRPGKHCHSCDYKRLSPILARILN